MVSEVQKVLRVSVLDVVFQEKSALKKENIICYLYLNEDILEDFEIKDDNHSITIQIGEKNDKLGVMLQVKETGDIIGCISFMAKMFESQLTKDLTQWVTLFDSPEDDEFDGDLGDDDEETPRILLKFSLETIPKETLKKVETTSSETKISTNVGEDLVRKKENLSPIKEGKVEEKGLESKIENLINVLETQRSLCQNSSRKEFISTENNNKTSSAEKDYLLQLEMEKNKFLEKSVKHLEEQLVKTEQLYKELEKQSHEKFVEISQTTTVLNKENYDLKSRIANFEVQIASFDQSKGKMTNNIFLDSDLKKVKSERDEERILNTKLKAEIKQIMNSNSSLFDDLKSRMEQFGHEIKSLHLEKGKLERTSQSLKSKIEVFELENKSLQTDLEISQREVQRLTQEIEEFKTLGSSFRKVVDELNKQKDNEINDLHGKIEGLNKELHDLNQENELLSATNQQLEKNSDILKLLGDDENKMAELEHKLKQANDENEKLKEQNKLHSDIQVQSQNVKLEYEINELKLKLKETEMIREKYQNAKKKLKLTQEENSGFKQKLDSMQQRLFATAAELVKQTSITVEQNNIIINLNEQMQILDNSLKTAFENITRLQSNIQNQQKSQDSVKKNDTTEAKLNSFLLQNGLPIKFKKDASGHYTFGTKKVSVNVLNGKFSITQMDGSSLLLEDFIRLYANQEILKMKASSSNMEPFDDHNNNNENQLRSKSNPKRTKYESNSSKTLKANRRSEAPSMSNLVNDLSDQDMDKTSEFLIYDITPQGGRDTIVQTKSKRNSQSKILTNDVVNEDHHSVENERKRRSSSKSQDPLRNSLNRISVKNK